MDARTCLKKLEYVGVLNFATVDEQGAPQIRNISAIHYEPDGIYFCTARGKEFCRQLLKDGRVQILGYTMYKESIRVSGQAVPAPDEEQEGWIRRIFEEQPYLKNVYPGDTWKIGIVFCIRRFSIEYFNLGVNPISRETYEVGGAQAEPKGYQITEDCIGCGICTRVCPAGCIHLEKQKAVHTLENCQICMACIHHCPKNAVRLTIPEKNPEARYHNEHIRLTEIVQANDQHVSL